MPSQYAPISLQEMSRTLVREMGLRVVQPDDPNSSEVVYEREITDDHGNVLPYTLRVYSSVDRDTEMTSGHGEKAIRVVLIDQKTGQPAKNTEKRVYRTRHAMANLRQRCVDTLSMALETPRCPDCGALMVERQNPRTSQRFLACTRYAPGRKHHCAGALPIHGTGGQKPFKGKGRTPELA